MLDGAMGTKIQGYGLTEQDFRGDRFQDLPGLLKGNNDVLSLTRPDVIADIHRQYLEVGADIISTNTFSSQRISQADYHLGDYAYEMAFEGARIARRVADEFSTPEKPRFVAGSAGPTNKTCSMSPDVNDPAARDLTYDELVAAYLEQMNGLIAGGVDALLIETIFDTLNAKAAIDAAMRAMVEQGKEVPVMLSVTISDLAGRTLSGQTLDAFLASVSSYPVFSVGLNCSFGADQMKPYLRELARKAPYYITCHPNAGLPNSMGLYDETAETMAPKIGEIIDEGLVNVIGGCCGTDETFIAKYVPLVRGEWRDVRGERLPEVWKKPHVPAPKPTSMWLSGLELLEVSPEVHFVNVGERCNVAGSRKFLRLIKEKSYDEALSIARKQVEDGALVIDINMDDGLLDAKAEMVNFLNRISAEPDIAKVPVMIDSSDWEVILAGLKCVQGKAIVNSISLKEGEERFITHAQDVKRLGAAVVVMCFDEQGQATTYERRIEIAQRAYKLLTERVGMLPQDIIFDPNVLAVATGMEEHDAYAADFIRATAWIHENLPGAHISGGISNLSFSFRGNNYIREAMHAVFLYHAIGKGMDFGIVNPSSKVTYNDIPQDQLEIIEDVILNRKKDAADRLTQLAEEILRSEECGVRSENTSAADSMGIKGNHNSQFSILNSQFGIDFLCFDAEDWGFPQWEEANDPGDTWALGAQYWAANPHVDGYKARYGILLDMVGGQGAQFYQEQQSLRYARSIVDKVWRASQVVGFGSFFPTREGVGITDDHLPVNRVAKIPCIDIIPYYPDCAQSSFGPTWHTVNDDMAHIDRNTLQAVGQTLVQLLWSEK